MSLRVVNKKKVAARYTSKEYRRYEQYIRFTQIGEAIADSLYTTANRRGFMARFLEARGERKPPSPPPPRQKLEPTILLPYHRHRRYAHLVPSRGIHTLGFK